MVVSERLRNNSWHILCYPVLSGNNELNYKSSNLDSKHDPSRGRGEASATASFDVGTSRKRQMPHGVHSLCSLTYGAIYRFSSQSHPSTSAKERVELYCIWTAIKQLALIFAGGN